jgi:uncharacterized membrane protein
MHKNNDRSTSIGLDRLVFLIDGVFVITLTLLVLDLRPAAMDDLRSDLMKMLPRLGVYLAAFYAIANGWVIHARTFKLITQADTKLAWLSIANLLFVTLLPASTALVGRYPFEPLAAACFSANHFFMSISVAAVWAYVHKNRVSLANEIASPVLRRMTTVGSTRASAS